MTPRPRGASCGAGPGGGAWWTRVLRFGPATALALPLCGQPAAAADDALIARGRYLAHDVAMCVQCHTPRLENGDLDQSRLFQGAPVPVEAPPFPRFAWASKAPAIVGLVGFTDDDEISLLTTGSRLSGRTPEPPMPPFRFSREDAAAIIAYLRSLPAPRR